MMRVAVACLTGALAASCSSDPAPPPVPLPFAQSDCPGDGLVEIARFSETFPDVLNLGMSNDLATDGATLFLAYSFSFDNAVLSSGVSPSGGVVAVPLSGEAPHVVAAADTSQTSQWDTGSFWVGGGQIHVQTETQLTSVPVDVASPATLPFVRANGVTGAYAHDADFAYYAGHAGGPGISVVKIPIDGGPATVLATEMLGAAVGGMADAGDALLLQMAWLSADETQTLAGIWRIPKDGSARTQVRADVVWADPRTYPRPVAWDGASLIGPVALGGRIVQARVAPDGTSAPQPLRLDGTIVTRRGDEILTLQRVYSSTKPSPMLVVASSKGNPVGRVVACGGEAGSPLFGTAVGIAATDDAIYVAYGTGDDTVIARVAP
jgi:hypothetical protein